MSLNPKGLRSACKAFAKFTTLLFRSCSSTLSRRFHHDDRLSTASSWAVYADSELLGVGCDAS